MLRTVFTLSLFLYQKSHSFDFWYKNNSCVNTVRQHFPWSILYNNDNDDNDDDDNEDDDDDDDDNTNNDDDDNDNRAFQG